jgi:hypothetical protein
MEARWGVWDCPYEGCEEERINDPDSIRVTCCGNGHTVLLGPVSDSGYRWAEKHEPDEHDLKLSLIEARIYAQSR